MQLYYMKYSTINRTSIAESVILYVLDRIYRLLYLRKCITSKWNNKQLRKEQEGHVAIDRSDLLVKDKGTF